MVERACMRARNSSVLKNKLLEGVDMFVSSSVFVSIKINCIFCSNVGLNGSGLLLLY